MTGDHSARRVLVLLAGLALGPFLSTPGSETSGSGNAAAASLAARVSMIVPATANVPSWPRWRGTSGQGLVSESGYPDSWSRLENILWRVPLPGTGNSSPIIWDDRIFLTTAYEAGRRRSILCVRRSDGDTLWESFAPDAAPESSHRKNGNASSTPVTDGERVYAYMGNHGLLAVNMNGKRAWHTPLGPFNAYHGTAGSPLLYRDRIIVVQDHRGGGGGSFIAAFSKSDGKLIWRTKRKATVGWNSPIAVRVDDHDEIIFSGQQQVTAYDPDTGAELWNAGGNTYEAIPTPVVGHGLVFASSGRAGPTLAIRPGGSGDVTRSHVQWRSPKGSPFVPSGILHGDRLYLVNDMTAIVTCHDALSGDVVWQGRLGTARREGFSASPVAVGERLFFTNDEGRTFVVGTGDEFEILHMNDLDEMVLASPALADGAWYFRTVRHLVAIGSSGGGTTATPGAAAD